MQSQPKIRNNDIYKLYKASGTLDGDIHYYRYLGSHWIGDASY